MARPLRVLCAIGSMGGGGSERQMLHVLRCLDRSRFAPLLYLVYRKGPLLDAIPEDVPVFAFWDRHEAPRWNVPGRIHRMQVRDFERILGQQRADLVYDRTFPMTLIAGPASTRCGVCRVSAMVSDPRQAVRQTAGRFAGAKRRRLRSAYHGADRVVAVSDGVRSAAIACYGLPPEKVVTVYNTIDLDQIDRLAEQACDRLEPGRFQVVAAGRLQHEKGYIYLLQAAERLVHQQGRQELFVHLLGTGPQRGRLVRFIQSRGLTHFVRLHGFLPNPYPLFRQANVLCLPSLFEGLPNVLLEAMACRTPVLAADCPSGPRELLADGKYGRLVPPADAAALAEALADAMTHYDRWQQIVEPARAHVERAFSLASGISALEQVLSSAHRSKAAQPSWASTTE